MQPLLAALATALPLPAQHSIPKPQLPPPRTPLDAEAKHITQSWLWPTIQDFLKSGDIIISETGTSNFGIGDTTFPKDVTLVTQIYYGSIGFATAATLGVDVARRELEAANKRNKGRTILLTGDGSMALTIQEVGTMIKSQCKAVLFVINNEGYTIERLIWGARQRMPFLFPFFDHF